MALAATLLCLAALGLALLAWLCQIRALSRPPRPAPRPCPPLSVLKPLKGADPDLEANLLSILEQDHPDFEVLFGIQDADDPAGEVARRVMAAHPRRRARLVHSREQVGLNPKVNNLAGLAAEARHELLLISDSNVRVGPGYLSDMAARIQDPGVGLVSSLIRGVPSRGLGSALESLQLNGFVMGGVAAWSNLFGQPCVVGKSMLLRRRDLERIGGFAFLGSFLAEDQVCGEEIARLGLRVVLSGQPVDNVLGAGTVKGFASRHLPWARIRRRISAAGFAAELVMNPVAMGLLGWAAGAGVTVPLLALAAMSIMALSAERRMGVRRPAALYPALELARSVMVALLWPVTFLNSGVTWRGHRLRIAARTRLQMRTLPPVDAWLPAEPAGRHVA